MMELRVTPSSSEMNLTSAWDDGCAGNASNDADGGGGGLMASEATPPQHTHHAVSSTSAEHGSSVTSSGRGSRSIDDFLESAYHHYTCNSRASSGSSHGSSAIGYMHRQPVEDKSILSDLFDCQKLSYHIIILALGLANASDASEILCLSYLLSDANFQDTILSDDGDHHVKGGIIASSVFFGMLTGGLVVGALGDALGRRPSLLFGLLTNAIAGMVSAASTNAYNLAFIRLIAGVGIGASVPPLFTMVTELSPPSRRGLFVTIVASFWMVGSLFVALVAILSFQICGWSWRAFALLCAIPSLAGAVAVWMVVPSSPRFLAKEDAYDEAVDVCNELAIKMGALGSATYFEDGPFQALQTEELMRQYPQQRRSYIASSPSRSNIGKMTSEALQATKGLYHPNLRNGITVPLQLIWFSLSFGSYGLLTWINSIFVKVHLQDLYFNELLFAAANLPGNILAGGLIDRIGRRLLLTLAMGCSALSLAAFAYFAKDSDSNSVGGDGTVNTVMIVLCACSFQAFSIAGWNALDTISGEVFPTSVRSTGMGVCTASGRIGALVAQFVNAALVNQPVLLLSVASATLLIGAASPCLLEGDDMARKGLEDDASEHHRSIIVAHDGMEGTKTRQGRYEPITSASYNTLHSTSIAESGKNNVTGIV